MTFDHGIRIWLLVRDLLAILVWPSVFLVVVVLFRKTFTHLLSNISRAELPWGAGALDFQHEAASLNADANRPDPEKASRTSAPPPPKPVDYNELQVLRGLKPTASGLDMNYFREVVLRDPNLALAGLRIEIEIVIGNLAIGSGMQLDQKSGVNQNLKSLFENGLITSLQFQTAQRVIGLCNRAVHGETVDATTALSVVAATEPLLTDYKEWLFWNFPG